MALVDYYVDLNDLTTGNTGTPEDPYSWADLSALMSVNTTEHAGKRFNIRGSITLTATNTWLADGTATSPIILRGCTSDWTPITPTRSNGGTGPLVVTNHPVITYNGNYFLNGSGSNYAIYQALSLTSASTGATAATLYNGFSCVVFGCVITNSANSGNARACRDSAHSTYLNSDFASTGSTASPSALLLYDNGTAIGCRILQSPGYGIGTYGTYSVILGCTITGCADYGIYYTATNVATGYKLIAFGNTIYGGKGIAFVDAAYGNQSIIVGNHVTDGAAYGVYSPNATGSPVVLGYNRTRDNTSGAVSWNGDWATATTFSPVTTDNGWTDGTYTHQTDYVSALTGDFRLVKDAAGVGQGIMGADIGAIQRQDILFDPTYLLAGYTAGDVTNPLYGNVVLPSASNVWFGTDNYGARYYYLGDRLGTLASDGGNRYFISYRNTLPNDVAVGTWININGKYAQIDFIDDVTCRLTNIPVDFPANGSGYLAAFYTALTGSVPSKRASSIIVPGDLRDGTEIDNVTGILKSPVEDNVRDGIPYGASDEYTGTLTLPAENKVLSGQNYGAAGIELSGNVTLPDEDRVITETQYGELGTEFTGDFVVPAESEVQIAVTFGPASDPLVGTFVGDCGDTYPDPDAVLDTETGWGEGYSQTGTYHAPDAIEVIDIAFFGPSSSIQGEYETGLLDPTPDTGIRVTMEEQEIYNEGSTIGFRIKITAHGDDVSPLPDDKVFLYQRRLVRPEGNITEDVFIAVCSPMDMEVYAADAPAEDSEPTFFRLNTLDVIHTSKTVLLEAWEDLKADLTKLANTMQDMDTLAKSEVLEYEWENTEPSSTTPSLSGTGLLLTMEEQEVYTEENTPGYRIKITAYGDDVEPLPDDKIFLYQRRLLQPEGNVTEDVFTAVCSVMDTQVYPADEPTDNSEPAFFRLNTVDVIHTSKTVLLEAWEDMKTDVASLVQTIQNMDDLADGESVTFNW